MVEIDGLLIASLYSLRWKEDGLMRARFELLNIFVELIHKVMNVHISMEHKFTVS
jgi:hypothetical protein